MTPEPKHNWLVVVRTKRTPLNNLPHVTCLGATTPEALWFALHLFVHEREECWISMRALDTDPLTIDNVL